MNLATIRDDLKARLGTISGLQVYDTFPAKPEVPCAAVLPASGIPHSAMGPEADVRFAVQILVQLAEWSSTQDALDGYVSTGSAGSAIDAIEQATTGTEDVMVESWDNYGKADLEDGTSYGTVTLNVRVRT